MGFGKGAGGLAKARLLTRRLGERQPNKRTVSCTSSTVALPGRRRDTAHSGRSWLLNSPTELANAAPLALLCRSPGAALQTTATQIAHLLLRQPLRPGAPKLHGRQRRRGQTGIRSSTPSGFPIGEGLPLGPRRHILCEENAREPSTAHWQAGDMDGLTAWLAREKRMKKTLGDRLDPGRAGVLPRRAFLRAPIERQAVPPFARAVFFPLAGDEDASCPKRIGRRSSDFERSEAVP